MSDARTALRLELPQGKIEGVALRTGPEGARSLRVFKGVPYAAAPAGALRWQSPQPAAPWTGVRTCDKFGPVAVQAGLPGLESHAGDFDCLNLNVWCPQEPGPWPVLVWIPGGGFMRGGSSDPLYDGRAMASAGMVFVSINYRLGVDGFMHFADAAPNRGLQDQIAALQWVQQHITLFGGDPNRVTVAGVSAGAGSITHLMGLPACDGLFQRALLQSPSLQSHQPDDAELICNALAGALGVPPTRQALAAVPLHALTNSLASFLGNEALKKQWGLRPKNFFPVRPVIDGTWLQKEPLQAIAQQLLPIDGKPVPDRRRREVLLGCNAEEMRFYLVPNGEIDRIDEARARAFIQDIGWPADTWHEYSARLPQGSAGDVLCCIQSDYYYNRPTRALEQTLQEGGCTTYRYEFGWPSPLHGGRMGAAHAMEIPFVLGNTATRRAQEFIGAVAPQALAHDIHSRWVRFVKEEPMLDWANRGERLRIFQ